MTVLHPQFTRKKPAVSIPAPMTTKHQLIAATLVVSALLGNLSAQTAVPSSPETLHDLRATNEAAQKKLVDTIAATNAYDGIGVPEAAKIKRAQAWAEAQQVAAVAATRLKAMEAIQAEAEAEAKSLATVEKGRLFAAAALDLRTSTAGPAAMDDSNAFHPAFELRATKEGGDASLRWGAAIKDYSFFSLTCSAPAVEDGDTPLATLDGFSEATTLELKLGWLWGKASKPDPSTLSVADSQPRQARYLAERLRKLRSASPSGVRATLLNHDDDPVDKAITDKAKEIANRTILTSVSGTIGYDNFDYLDALTLAEQSSRKKVYGGKIDCGWYFGEDKAVVFNFTYQDAFQGADEASFALPPGTNGLQEVKTGPIGPPNRSLKRLYSAQFLKRTTIGKNQNCGIAVKVTYDQVDDVFGVRVPVYFIQSDTGAATGGIEFGWTDQKDSSQTKFTVGVIVGAGLTINPFGRN